MTANSVATDGPTASLRRGLSHSVTRRATTVVVLLGDQPRMTDAVMRQVLAPPGEIVRAHFGGAPGHPIVVRGRAAGRLRSAADTSARRDLLHHTAVAVDVSDPDAGVDVDRPEDLARLGRRSPSRASAQVP